MENVSVIIPVYNRADRIGRCLESVLRQTYRAVEIIIIDDGSTDNLEEMIRPVWNQVRLIRQENKGQGAARNAGIQAAKGEWIAFLDSDDLWDEKKLEIQMNSILTKGYEWGHTKARIIPTSDRPRFFGDWFRDGRSGMIARQLLQTNFICTSSVVLKKDILEEVGCFSEDRELQNFEDYELWLRIAALVGIDYVDEPLTLYTTESLDSAQQESRLMQIEKNERVMQHIERLPFTVYSKKSIRKRRIGYQQYQFQNALVKGDIEQAQVILKGLRAIENRKWKLLVNKLLVDSPRWLIESIFRVYHQFIKIEGI